MPAWQLPLGHNGKGPGNTDEEARERIRVKANFDIAFIPSDRDLVRNLRGYEFRDRGQVKSGYYRTRQMHSSSLFGLQSPEDWDRQFELPLRLLEVQGSAGGYYLVLEGNEGMLLRMPAQNCGFEVEHQDLEVVDAKPERGVFPAHRVSWWDFVTRSHFLKRRVFLRHYASSKWKSFDCTRHATAFALPKPPPLCRAHGNTLPCRKCADAHTHTPLLRDETVPLQNQGNLGTCFAHASARVVTRFVFLHRLEDVLTPDFVGYTKTEYYLHVQSTLQETFGLDGSWPDLCLKWFVQYDRSILETLREKFEVAVISFDRAEERRRNRAQLEYPRFVPRPPAPPASHSTPGATKEMFAYRQYCFLRSRVVASFRSDSGPVKEDEMSSSEDAPESRRHKRSTERLKKALIDGRSLVASFCLDFGAKESSGNLPPAVIPPAVAQWHQFSASSTDIRAGHILPSCDPAVSPGGHAVVLFDIADDVDVKGEKTPRFCFKNSWGPIRSEQKHAVFSATFKALAPDKYSQLSLSFTDLRWKSDVKDLPRKAPIDKVALGQRYLRQPENHHSEFARMPHDPSREMARLTLLTNYIDARDTLKRLQREKKRSSKMQERVWRDMKYFKKNVTNPNNADDYITPLVDEILLEPEPGCLDWICAAGLIWWFVFQVILVLFVRENFWTATFGLLVSTLSYFYIWVGWDSFAGFMRFLPLLVKETVDEVTAAVLFRLDFIDLTPAILQPTFHLYLRLGLPARKTGLRAVGVALCVGALGCWFVGRRRRRLSVLFFVASTLLSYCYSVDTSSPFQVMLTLLLVGVGVGVWRVLFPIVTGLMVGERMRIIAYKLLEVLEADVREG